MSARKRRQDRARAALPAIVEPPIKAAKDHPRFLSEDPAGKLRQYFSELGPGEVPSGLYVLVYTRELIEYHDAHQRYPIANTYGNWSVHIRLDGSAPGYRMLAEFNRRVSATKSPAAPPSLDLMLAAVHEALGLAQLRKELRALFAEHQIQAPFLESRQQWNRLLSNMFGELVGKPISFPPGPVDEWKKANVRHMYKTARAEVIRRDGNAASFVTRMFLGLVPSSSDPSRGILHWVMVCEGHSGNEKVVIRSPVWLPVVEPRSAFAFD
jgi:hypothetical protein